MKKKKFRINLHVIFAIAVVVILGIIISKFWGFGRTITREDIEAIPVPENPELADFDYIVPVMGEDDGTFPEDDGVTTVVCLGNNPFSDDRDSEDNLCNLFAKETGATVYNCSIPGSYMSSYNDTFLPNDYPMDAFSLYWLTTVFTIDNDVIVEQAYEAMGEVPEDIKESVDLLQSIDFRSVDAIFIMYDASDYLDGRDMYSDDNFTDPTQFTGAMAASVELIEREFPWIRIIVLSPSYAYAVEDDGTYVSSEKKIYNNQHYLSTYVNKQLEAAYRLEISFVNNLFVTITEDTADDYLVDNLHLNAAGRKLIADRMKYALERYTTIY